MKRTTGVEIERLIQLLAKLPGLGPRSARRAALHLIKNQLPGVLSITSGRSESPEKIERGYLHGFVVDFSDSDALAAYQAHPDHRRVGEALVACAIGGLDGILVFDLPVTTATP